MNTNEQKTEIADIDERYEIDIQEKLNSSKIQFPNWKPSKIGQTITGYVKEILTFKDLNGKERHGILINLQTKNDNFPIVSIWSNTVILSNLKKLSYDKSFESFENLTNSLKTVENRTIAIRYEGEVQPAQKGFKPYQNFTIVEI